MNGWTPRRLIGQGRALFEHLREVLLVAGLSILLGAAGLTFQSSVLVSEALSPGLSGDTRSIYAVCVSQDERWLLVRRRRGDIELYDCARKLLFFGWRSSDLTSAAALSGSGKLMLVGTIDGRVCRFVDGKPCGQLPAVEGAVTSIEISPQDKFAAVAAVSGQVTLWNLPDFVSRPLEPIEEDRRIMLRFSPDGCRLLGATDFGSLIVWELRSGRIVQRRETGRCLLDAEYSRDGSLVVVGGAGTKLQLWDTSSLQALWCVDTVGVGTHAIAVSPDRRLIAVGGIEEEIELWDIESRRCRQIETGHTSSISELWFSADGRRLFSGSYDGTIRVRELATLRETCLLPMPGAAVDAPESTQ